MKTLPFFLGVCFLFSIYVSLNHASQPKPIDSEKLKKIASDFGLDFFGFANIISKHDEVQKRFQTSVGFEVKKIELKELVEEMVNETNASFKEKIEAIRKVMSTAEEAALEHFQRYDNPVGPDGKPLPKKSWPDCYRNARKVNKHNFPSKPVEDGEEAKKEEKCDLTKEKMDLKKDSHFGASVNTTFSIIHTPTSIYDQRADVLEGIEWTKILDKSYISNYQNNPTLYWQYFCSYKGFFRQYPAIKWAIDNSEKHNPDLYDCRMRPWYIAAANTPKNVIILHDVSGSMTGLRREIAKHVVFTVLETLTDNDYVNVFNFTDATTPVVACFKDGLVQANLENIREFKVALDQHSTAGVANFTAAFNTAFDILEKARGGKPCISSDCNEAIFLITDGVPYKYEEIFDERNKDPNKLEPDDPGYNDPKIQTRVFTYLIGREVTQKGEVMWIACNNKGYYVHITTLGEVQEQVLRYMHVMSKPMVLEQEHNVSWTPVYADVAEIIESDWLWDDKNAKRQKERSERYKIFKEIVFNQSEGQGDKFYVVTEGEGGGSGKETKRIAGKRVAEFLDYGITNPDEEQLRIKFALEERIERAKLHRWGPDRKFKFMVSVSLPVFDLRNTTVRRTKAKADKEEKIAIFLGVVGTDIPIKELQKIASPFKLGVNGYAFAITENGYIVFHPDWRPLLIDILKPNYNTVDLTEVEIVNSDIELRNQDEHLLNLRKSMIDMEVGPSGSHSLEVRIHQDNFKRVIIRKQQYAYAKINQTQYTLGIAIPTGNPYKFVGEVELRRDGHGKDFTHYFEGVSDSRKWRINPDWTYCEFIRGEHPELQSKEDVFIHFLRDIQNASVSWAWRNTGVGIKRTHKDNLEEDIYSCQKDLVQSLVFDANVTEVFTSSNEWRFNNTQSQLAQRYGAVIAFIATRSGLTRWINITADDFSSSTDIPFIEDNARATEEIWYKRAVERYNIEKQSYVISVPHDAGTRNDSPPLVTATRAVFVTGKDKNKKNGKNLNQAPVAVTGVQFNYENLSQRFLNFAQNACKADAHNCYLLDDNAFIIYSSVKTSDIGRFFGEVNGAAMEKLATEGDLKVYKRVRVVDYQAICYHLVGKTGFANILLTPFNHLKFLFQWFVAKLAWLALQINVHSLFYPDFSSVLANAITAISDDQELMQENPNSFPYLELASINKTRLRPCHQEYFLYTYVDDVKDKDQKPAPKSIFYKSDKLPSCGDYGLIQAVNIPKTNLIMVVTDARCDRGKIKTNIKASEVQYDLDEEVLNITYEKEIISQICRTPYLPLYRKRPKSCFNYHEEESLLREDCGSAATIIETSVPCLLILWITALIF